MSSPWPERLATLGHLKREPPSEREIAGLLRVGRARLADSQRTNLAIESRFDLACNAAHALALAALRCLGFRAENRYLVFQCLAHTTKLPTAQWRILAAAHRARNLLEYEGGGDADERLVEALIAATCALDAALEARRLQCW